MRKIVSIILTLAVFGGSTFAQVKAQNSLDNIPVVSCGPSKCDAKSIAVRASTGSAGFSTQLLGFFVSLLDTSQWPERWNRGVWTPLHGWIYMLSDFFIWLSYFAIPLILGYFIYKKRNENMPFKTVLVLFIVFILACGFTHLMDAAIFWWPAYKLSAALRLGTALVSMVTVVSLIKVIPGVLELKSPAHLEQQVDARTKDLRNVNKQLNIEIAERKKTVDHLKASNQELMAFSYSVSHDLRAPLRSIHGFSQALVEDYGSKLDKEGIDFLMRICNASSRMGELIDDMLKLSKISRDEVVVEDIDLSAMVQEVVTSHIQRNPGICTSFEIENNMHTRGDRKLIKIAVENLIDNAIKYSSKNNLPQVQFGKIINENVFFVKDNGVGFDMQFVDKLFGAFQRLHEGEFEGSGIGLATVKRIIVKHGGTIRAEGKVSEGATFYFTI